MSRRKKAREAAGVQLFPFLAVLLCAMGALIVVLMIVAHQARVQAREAAARPDPDREQRLAARAAQQTQWTQHAENLRTQTASGAALLARKLDNVKGLQGTLSQTLREIDQIRAGQEDLARASRDPTRAGQVQRQAAELDAKIRDAQTALKDRKRSSGLVPQLFSIVPYAGRNGAARRPIYIECRGQTITLQPEDTELAASDFEVLGPGNPLEAAVRASVAYWENTLGDNAGKPYPLLLVRPDGVTAYHAAREALSTWGGEFGYELVDAEWKVAYPQPDPQLAQRQQAAMQIAREQMRRLAQLETRRRKSSPSFKIAPDGTLQREDTADEEGDGPRRRDAFGGPVSAKGPLGEGGISGEPFGSGPRSGQGPGNRSVLNDGPFTARQPLRPGQADSGASGPRQPQESAGSSDSGSFFAGGPATADNREIGPMFGPRGPVQPGGAMHGPEGQVAAGSSALPMALPRVVPGTPGYRPPPGEYPTRNTGGAASSPNAGPQFVRQGGNGGVSRGSNAGAGGAPAGSGGGASASGGGAPPGAGMPGPAGAHVEPPEDAAGSVGMTANLGGGNCKSIADKEGANWALPNRPKRVSSPLRRTVRLVIDADTVTIFADPRGSQTLKVIRLTRNTTDSVDELKAAVWRIMETWGDAPQDLHWRPVLLASVSARGALRYQELSVLLRGSGFELTDTFTPGS